MNDKLEIRRLRVELKIALRDLEIYEQRNEEAIRFIEKYSILFGKVPKKLGLSIKETNDLLKLLKGEYDERYL